MSSSILIVVVIVVFLGLLLFQRRNRARAELAQQAEREAMGPGTAVMTTSGLYGTIVSMDLEAHTAVLSIAPGTEVTWALAALKDVHEMEARINRVPGQRPGRVPLGTSGADRVGNPDSSPLPDPAPRPGDEGR